jgi:hypothetical protein
MVLSWCQAPLVDKMAILSIWGGQSSLRALAEDEFFCFFNGDGGDLLEGSELWGIRLELGRLGD